MLVRSTINPKSIWVRKIEKSSDGLVAVFRVRWNVRNIESEDMDGKTHSEYEYDEQELKQILPVTINSVDDLISYVKVNKASLLSQAKKFVEPVVAKAPANISITLDVPWYTQLGAVEI